MKWLIYLFALANLMFFLWHYQPGQFDLWGQQVQRVPVDEEAGVPKLVLLHEFEASQQQASSAEPTPDAPPHCYHLGPFAGKAEAKKLEKELLAASVDAGRYIRKDKSRKGFWVLMPPAKTRKAARSTIEQLKTKKVKDFFLVATGSQKNAISLGVFSRADLAKRRLKRLTVLGFEAHIEKVDLPKREYWLEWPSDEQVAAPVEIVNRWSKQYPEIGQTVGPCRTAPK